MISMAHSMVFCRISVMNAAVDGLMRPTHPPGGKLQPEPHPLGDRVRITVMSGIVKQLCDVVQQGGTTSPVEAYSNGEDRVRCEQRTIYHPQARAGRVQRHSRCE